MRKMLSAMAALVMSFVLVACEDGINHDILESKNSVLAVISEKDDNVAGTENGIGTGFFIADNVIITNKHVVEKAAKIKVALEDSPSFYEARVVHSDPIADIAVLELEDWDKFKSENTFGHLRLANKDDLTLTEEVYAIGNPWGLAWTISKGILSAIDRRPSSSPKILLQTDAHVFQGNSGGPLLNYHGEVIGVNSLMMANEGGSYGFALPVRMLEKVLSDFETYDGSVRWAFLGLKLGDTVIEEVMPGLPAEEAGLLKDDVILEYTTSEGTFKPRAKNLSIAMTTHDSAQDVKIVVERNGEELTFLVRPIWKDSETIIRESASTERPLP